MTKILWLAMLCIASASCVELENICSSDIFSYKDVVVKAFHRVQWNVTFDGLSHYMINDTVKCDRSEFQNKSNLHEALRLKQVYNGKFAELYTENLAHSTAKKFEEKGAEMYQDVWNPLFVMAGKENGSKCLNSFEKTVWAGFGVVKVLQKMFISNAYPTDYNADYKPTNSEAKEMLTKLMTKLNTSADDQVVFAFIRDDPSDVLFHKKIVIPKGFKFLRDAELKVQLSYEQFMPFGTEHHNNTNCVTAKDLPAFYKKKGKD